MIRVRKKQLINGALIAAAMAVSVIWLLPFTWMLATSLRPSAQSYALPPSFFPTQFALANYRRILTADFPFLNSMLNSVKVTAAVMLGQFVTCALAAYSFARLRFPGRNLIFGVMLSTMMIPVQVTIIPTFIAMSKVGLVDTLWAIILPYLTSVFGIFLLRQFFAGLPAEIEEAARIDGAGIFATFWRIALPQVRPALSALAIITMNGTWNNYFTPLVFISKWEQMTLPLAVTAMKGYYGNGDLSAIMAAVMLAALPIVLVFLFAQKHFVEGMAMSAVKG